MTSSIPSWIIPVLAVIAFIFYIWAIIALAIHSVVMPVWAIILSIILLLFFPGFGTILALILIYATRDPTKITSEYLLSSLSSEAGF